MHDVIHQMAIWVASNFGEEEERVIVKTDAGLQQMLDCNRCLSLATGIR